MKSNEKQIREINYVKRICKKAYRQYLENKANQAVDVNGEKKKRKELSADELAEIELAKKVKAIRKTIALQLPQGHRLTNESLPFNSVAIVSFKISRPVTPVEAEALYQRMIAWNDAHPNKKPKTEKDLPKEARVMTVNIYRSVKDKHKIGSITIYGEGLAKLREKALISSSLYGLPVASATIERGIATYLDIAIRA